MLGFRCGRSVAFGHRILVGQNVLAIGHVLDFFIDGFVMKFVSLLRLFLHLLPIHHCQKLKQDPLEFLERVKQLDSSTSVETSGFQEPHVAVLGVIGLAVERFAENVDFFLDLRILPGHVILHLPHKRKRPALLAILPGIIFLEKVDELLQIILTILVIEVKDEGNWSDAKNFHFFGLTINLQIFDQHVLSTEFLTKLEMVDNSLFSVGPHLLIIVLILVEDPFEVGDALP